MSADDSKTTNEPGDKLEPYSPTGEVGVGAEEIEFGGGLAGIPLPREPFYPLRQDQFLTLRDGETSEARALRDACIGALVAAVVGIAGLLAVIKWDAPITEQKVAIGATMLLCVGAATALIVALVQQRQINRTRMKSAYSRLVSTIETRFQVPQQDSESMWRHWNEYRVGRFKDVRSLLENLKNQLKK